MPKTRSSRRSSILTPSNHTNGVSSASSNNSLVVASSEISNLKNNDEGTTISANNYSSPSDENTQPVDNGHDDAVNENKKKKKKRTISERSPALNKSRKKSTAAVVKINDDSTSSSSTHHPTTPSQEDKENQPTTPGVTPYWKIAEERGGTFSPRQTRSAKKSNRPCNIPRYSDVSPSHTTSTTTPSMKQKDLSRSTTKKISSKSNGSSNSTDDELNEENANLAILSEQRELFQTDKEVADKNESSTTTTSSTYKNQFCLDFSPQPINNNNKSNNATTTSKLKQETISLKKQIKSLQFKLESQQKKNVDLEKEIMSLQARFEYQRDVKNLDMRLTKLSNDLNNQSAQQELVEMMNGLREEKKELQMKFEDLEREHKKLVIESEGRRVNHKDESATFEQEVVTLREQIEEHKQQRDMAQANYQKIFNDLETFHKEAGDLQGIVTSLREENTQLKQTLDKEKEQNKKSKSDYEEAIENLNATLNENQSLESSALTTVQEEKMKVISQLEKIESELELKNSTIFNMSDKEAELEKMNEELMKRCEEAEKEIEEVRSESNKLRENLTTTSSSVETLQQRLDEAEVVHGEVSKMKDELNELHVAVDEEKQTNNQLREQSVLLQQSLSETTEEAEQVKEQLVVETKKKEELAEKYKSAEKVIEQNKETLKVTTSKLMNQTQINEDLSSNVDQLNNELKTNAESYADEKKNFLHKIAELEQKLNQSEAKREEEKSNHDAQLDSINAELKEEKRMNEKLNEQLFQTMEQYENDKKQFKKQITEKNYAIDELQKRCKAMMKKMSSFNTRESALCEKILKQEEVRRSLHNRVMQLSGNIRVFVRVRPVIGGEDSTSVSPYSYPTYFDGNKTSSDTSVGADDDLTKRFIVALEPEKDRGGLSQRRKKLKFGFDNVFDPTNGQDSLWEATEPLVQSAVDGYNVCVFAYGQTGSGKTYTMLGTETNPGLITSSIKKLFDSKRAIEETSKGASTVTISVELLEIYNEQVRDLLNDKKGMGGYEDVNLSLNSSEAVGNIVLDAIDEDHVMKVLQKAQKRRCVKATKSNAESSRSHLIFTLNFNLSNATGVQRKSRLSICDLAGSERLSKSESLGAARREAQHINKSLSSLSNVIEKLQQKNAHIPYRESKLTYLLQNSLGGDSKTLAIVCCNPLVDHFQETTCSLRFAQKLNKVELKALANISC